jgi:cytidyltransferase-like protein
MKVKVPMLKPNSEKALEKIRRETQQKKIVSVSGFFNIVHPGHLRLLKSSAERGDYLVVGVYDDASESSLLAHQMQHEGIATISLVDHSFVLEDKIDEFISELKPAIIVKGMEHEYAFNPEADAVKSYGGKLLSVPAISVSP